MSEYTLLEKRFIKEADAWGYVYIHNRTQAKLIHLECADSNKCFMVSFPTIPEDSTGVAHIIEHSVLAGSEKYPLKDPFFELVKGSLNTFLNAFTAPDCTMYPFASTNEKDFMNMLDVYLDAVFHPTLYTKKETFLQEGWHYELDENGDLIINGIVYNEMRGAMSNPDRVLYQQLLAALFDNCYQYNAGGDPSCIPELSYEDFCAFHQKHYHPSNAVFYLYGDMDAEKVMTYIDKNCLSDFDFRQPLPPVPPTAAFNALVSSVGYYPVNTADEAEHAAMLGKGYVLCGPDNVKDSTALSILSNALFNTEASPVRRALMQSGLCRDVDVDCDTSMKQGLLVVTVKGADAENLDAINELIDNTLAEILKKGLDKELLTGCLNIREFYLREEHGGMPRGLILGMSITSDTVFSDDCFASICYDNILADLRIKIDSDYYEALIEKYLINNPHSAVVRLLPETGLAGKRDAALAAQLRKYKAALSDSELSEIRNTAEKLKAMQMTPDAPELLERIPLLTLDDIGDAPRRCKAEEVSFGNIPGLFCDVQSNGICYLDLIFNADCLDDEDLHYAGLLTDVLGKVDTDKYDFSEISKKTLLHTGGIAFSCGAAAKYGQPDGCTKTFTVSSKILLSELESALALQCEIINHSSFSNLSRLQELLGTISAGNRSVIMSAGHSVALNRLLSYFSDAGVAAEQISGLEQAKWIDAALSRFEEVGSCIVSGLERTAKKLFCLENLTIAVGGGRSELDKVQEYLPILVSAFPHSEKKHIKTKLVPAPLNEGIAAAADAQYVGIGYSLARLGYSYSGTLAVMRTILSTEYLIQRVRIVGGAYGCFCLVRPLGSCIFLSYRDPNLAATYDVFNSVADYLADFNASERDLLKFIIGTLRDFDSPMAPGEAARAAIADYRCGITREMRLRWRNEAVNTTIEDIRRTAEPIRAMLTQGCRCVFGGSEKLEKEGSMLKSIITTSTDAEKYTF